MWRQWVKRGWALIGHVSTLSFLGAGALASVAFRAFTDLYWPWVVLFGFGVAMFALAAFLTWGRPALETRQSKKAQETGLTFIPDAPLEPWHPPVEPAEFKAYVRELTDTLEEAGFGRDPHPQQPEQAEHTAEVRAALREVYDDLRRNIRLTKTANQSGRYWHWTAQGVTVKSWTRRKDLLSRQKGLEEVVDKVSEAFEEADRVADAQVPLLGRKRIVLEEHDLPRAITKMEAGIQVLRVALGLE